MPLFTSSPYGDQNVKRIVSVGCFWIVLFGPSPAEADQRQQALAVVSASLENYKRATKTFSCTVRMRYGTAPTVRAARETGPTKVLEKCAVRWIKHGQRIRLQLMPEGNPQSSPAPQEANVPSGRGGIPKLKGTVRRTPGPAFPPHAFLAGKGYLLSLFAEPEIATGYLQPFNERADYQVWTPWNFHGLDTGHRGVPMRILLRWLESDSPHLSFRYQTTQREQGKSLRVLRFELKPPGAAPWFYEASFDPQAGFLCVETVSGDVGPPNRVSRRSWVLKTREVAPGVWWPVRGIVCTDVGKEFQVLDFEVTDLSLEVPSEKDFSLELPRGLLLADPQVEGKRSLVLAKSRKVLADELPQLHEQVVAAMQGRDVAPGAGSWWLFVAVGVGAVFLFGCACWYVVKKNAKTRS